MFTKSVEVVFGERYFLSQEFHGACGWFFQKSQKIQQGCFSGSIGTEETDNLPLIYLEGDVLEGLEGPVVFCDILNFNHLLSVVG